MADGKGHGFLIFPKALAQNETASARTHTQVIILGQLVLVKQAKQVADVLDKCNSVSTVMAILLYNTNANLGCEGGLLHF